MSDSNNCENGQEFNQYNDNHRRKRIANEKKASKAHESVKDNIDRMKQMKKGMKQMKKDMNRSIKCNEYNEITYVYSYNNVTNVQNNYIKRKQKTPKPVPQELPSDKPESTTMESMKDFARQFATELRQETAKECAHLTTKRIWGAVKRVFFFWHWW